MDVGMKVKVSRGKKKALGSKLPTSDNFDKKYSLQRSATCWSMGISLHNEVFFFTPAEYVDVDCVGDARITCVGKLS